MSENLNVFITQDENFNGISLKKSKFYFYFIVYTPMRVSDVINNVTKQTMNIMALTLSAFKHVKRWRDKNNNNKKKNRQIEIILISNSSCHSI